MKHNKQLIREKWLALPERFRTLQQMYGRNEEGCGATIGVMPKCDFACTGCYLGKGANKIPMDSVESIKKQLDLLRTYLGKWGNLQLTDGEITLRDEEDLIEILQYAHKIELIPMIMTHGDHFRKKPELLYKLVKEAHLREVSFHIDTTQRGRYGKEYKNATSELELIPLREEFAELIRSVKTETGHTLRAASTITTSNKNIKYVSKLIPWFIENSDAFRMVSFLPLSQVGRTIEGLDGVHYQDIWKEIEKALKEFNPPGKNYSDKTTTDSTQWWMGHPECNKFVFGHILKEKKKEDKKQEKLLYRRISIAESKTDRDFFEEVYSKWPGITFRPYNAIQITALLLKMFISKPFFFLFKAPRYFYLVLKDFKTNSVLTNFLKIITNRAKLHRLTIVTHHFMNEDELETDLGKERLDHCSFKVPFNGELISMCEMNAKSFRQDYYKQLSTQKEKKGVRT